MMRERLGLSPSDPYAGPTSRTTSFIASTSAVYRVFHELGYRRPLAFELSRLCTTTRRTGRNDDSVACVAPYWHSDQSTYSIYSEHVGRLGALPQGAPTSAILSNLAAALGLDRRLHQLAVSTYGSSHSRDGCRSLPIEISHDGRDVPNSAELPVEARQVH